MGAFIRAVLRLWGIAVPHRHHLTFVSKTIEMLPLSKKWRPFAGGALHLIVALVILAWLAALRSDQMSYNVLELGTLILALVWCFIGPALIWCYERRTVPALMRQVRKRVSAPQGRGYVRSMLRRNVLRDHTSLLIMAIWVTAVAAGLLGSTEFIAKFAVNHCDRPLPALHQDLHVKTGHFGGIGPHVHVCRPASRPRMHDDQELGFVGGRVCHGRYRLASVSSLPSITDF